MNDLLKVGGCREAGGEKRDVGVRNYLKGTSINHLGEVRLFITRYKPEAQCRDIQISENCVPKGRDIYSELTEPT